MWPIQLTETPCKSDLGIWAHVLIANEENLMLHQKLIETIAQTGNWWSGKIHNFDFGTNYRSEFGDFQVIHSKTTEFVLNRQYLRFQTTPIVDEQNSTTNQDWLTIKE